MAAMALPACLVSSESTTSARSRCDSATSRVYRNGAAHKLLAGVKRIVQSIRDVGWLEQFPPSVVIRRDCLGNGDKLTAEVALGVVGRTLDGNHRITALKEVYNEETVIPVRVYMEFNESEERLIANGELSSVRLSVVV